MTKEQIITNVKDKDSDLNKEMPLINDSSSCVNLNETLSLENQPNVTNTILGISKLLNSKDSTNKENIVSDLGFSTETCNDAIYFSNIISSHRNAVNLINKPVENSCNFLDNLTSWPRSKTSSGTPYNFNDTTSNSSLLNANNNNETFNRQVNQNHSSDIRAISNLLNKTNGSKINHLLSNSFPENSQSNISANKDMPSFVKIEEKLKKLFLETSIKDEGDIKEIQNREITKGEVLFYQKVGIKELKNSSIPNDDQNKRNDVLPHIPEMYHLRSVNSITTNISNPKNDLRTSPSKIFSSINNDNILNSKEMPSQNRSQTHLPTFPIREEIITKDKSMTPKIINLNNRESPFKGQNIFSNLNLHENNLDKITYKMGNQNHFVPSGPCEQQINNYYNLNSSSQEHDSSKTENLAINQEIGDNNDDCRYEQSFNEIQLASLQNQTSINSKESNTDQNTVVSLSRETFIENVPKRQELAYNNDECRYKDSFNEIKFTQSQDQTSINLNESNLDQNIFGSLSTATLKNILQNINFINQSNNALPQSPEKDKTSLLTSLPETNNLSSILDNVSPKLSKISLNISNDELRKIIEYTKSVNNKEISNENFPVTNEMLPEENLKGNEISSSLNLDILKEKCEEPSNNEQNDSDSNQKSLSDDNASDSTVLYDDDDDSDIDKKKSHIDENYSLKQHYSTKYEKILERKKKEADKEIKPNKFSKTIDDPKLANLCERLQQKKKSVPIINPLPMAINKNTKKEIKNIDTMLLLEKKRKLKNKIDKNSKKAKFTNEDPNGIKEMGDSSCMLINDNHTIYPSSSKFLKVNNKEIPDNKSSGIHYGRRITNHGTFLGCASSDLSKVTPRRNKDHTQLIKDSSSILKYNVQNTSIQEGHLSNLTAPINVELNKTSLSYDTTFNQSKKVDFSNSHKERMKFTCNQINQSYLNNPSSNSSISSNHNFISPSLVKSQNPIMNASSNYNSPQNQINAISQMKGSLQPFQSDALIRRNSLNSAHSLQKDLLNNNKDGISGLQFHDNLIDVSHNGSPQFLTKTCPPRNKDDFFNNRFDFNQLANPNGHLSTITTKSVLNDNLLPSIPTLNCLKNPILPSPNTINPSQTLLPVSSINIHNHKLIQEPNIDSRPISKQKLFPKNLVPKTIKKQIGKQPLKTFDVLLLILEWNAEWLAEQVKNQMPPPILGDETSNSSQKIMKTVMNSYLNFESYYNTYLPLLLQEIWQRLYSAWTHINQLASYFCKIISHREENFHIKVGCEINVKLFDYEKGLCPEEGSILLVKFIHEDNSSFKALAYVNHVSLLNSIQDSQNSIKNNLYRKLTLNFLTTYWSQNINFKENMRLQLLCNINPLLKQNEALFIVQKTSLCRILLDPLQNGVNVITLAKRKLLSESDIESNPVEMIMETLKVPHSLPRLTLVKSLPSSDRLLTLVQLIEEIKKIQDMKILLCARTKTGLMDLIYNITGNNNINLVIIGKRTNIHHRFRKFMLEELAIAELNSSKDNAKEKEIPNEELLLNAKQSILKKSHIILSHIQFCYDELVLNTLTLEPNRSLNCCIIDEANLCTEPETLIPLLYGFKKLILIGDPDNPAKVCSKTASAFYYNRSLFERACSINSVI